MKDIQD